MHFAILDTAEKKDDHGSFISYGISINGGYHSALRYSQLREFHDQLKKDFGDKVPATFPPKKLLGLNMGQVEERREQLEKYLQAMSQDPALVSSRTFIKFMLKAQKESHNVEEEDVKLDLYLMNGKTFQVDVRNTDSTDHVMHEAMAHIKLPEKMTDYFSLFLMEREDDVGEISLVRKLQGFESPFIALLTYKGTHQLVIRKNFWNSKIEDELFEDKTALNLLYVQAVSDVEEGCLVTTPEILEELSKLKKHNQRKKYLKLARTQKFYGYVRFKPCVMDFPESDSHATINVGGFELSFHIVGTQEKKDTRGSFKVTRIKCWRVVSSKDAKNGEVVTKVAFQYLFSKEKLQWITITSDQAMLISLCLQSMVDEIVKERNSGKPSASKESKTATKATSSNEENSGKPAAVANDEQPTKPRKRDSASSLESNEGSHTPKNGTKENETAERKRGKKEHRKKIAQVKNEVFAQDIGDDDL